MNYKHLIQLKQIRQQDTTQKDTTSGTIQY